MTRALLRCEATEQSAEWSHAEQSGDFSQALIWTRRRLAIDPLHEKTHHDLIEL